VSFRVVAPERGPARRAHRTLAVAAVLAAGVLLAGCAGSNPSRDAAGEERAQEQRQETKLADFARCMREHGVDAETVRGPAGAHGIKISARGAAGAGSGPPGMEHAQKACARFRPEPKGVNLSPQQKAEVAEQLQKFAKCMREHGIKVETSTQGGGIQIGIHHAGSGGPNPESPGFQAAQSACQKLLPKPVGARAGGPFGTKSDGPPAPSSNSESGSAGG